MVGHLVAVRDHRTNPASSVAFPAEDEVRPDQRPASPMFFRNAKSEP
jgi:hypothetical protein